ncbi:MAG: TadE/TadG family type IV pilus assembly protein [Pirellulaceae bacterium]
MTGHQLRIQLRNIAAGPPGRRPRRGAAVVELAFVAPFILFLVFGAFEFFRMMMVKQALTNAAREGCRTAVLVTTESHQQAEAVTRSYLRGVMADFEDVSKLRISISPAFESVPNGGSEISTSVEVDCADVSWLPPMFLAGAKIRGAATMQRE